jgi:flavin-dependent dehydrogenase
VYLAMYSGRMAAHAITELLPTGKTSARRLRRYEKDVRNSMKFYWQMVHQFYTTPFLEILFHPKEKFMLASAVNAALAGELEGGFDLRWRMRLFFWFVRAQKILGFAPRISFQG